MNVIVRVIPGQNSGSDIILKTSDISEAIQSAHWHRHVYSEEVGIYNESGNEQLYTTDGRSHGWALTTEDAILGVFDKQTELDSFAEHYCKVHQSIPRNSLTVTYIIDREEVESSETRVTYIVSKMQPDESPAYDPEYDKVFTDAEEAINDATERSKFGLYRYVVTVCLAAYLKSEEAWIPFDTRILYRPGDRRTLDDIAVPTLEPQIGMVMPMPIFLHACAEGHITSLDGTARLIYKNKPSSNITVDIERGYFIIETTKLSCGTIRIPAIVFYDRYVNFDPDSYAILWQPAMQLPHMKGETE